jgi:glycosyltransferase involved in cell wall biosynthesis
MSLSKLLGIPYGCTWHAYEIYRVILAVGRFVAKKGFAYLLDAAGILKREGRHFEVRFIGDGPDRAALESQVNRLGIRNEVRFLGVRPNAEVFDQIDAARVVAVPSVVTDEGDMDGLPNVVLEALGMSRPVVGSRVSAIPEVLVEGETGFLVAPGDANELAAKLGLLLDDPTLAARLGRQGRMRIVRDFDVKKNVRTVIDTITHNASAAQARVS